MENSKVQKHIKNETNLPGNQENQCALYLPPSPGKSLNTNMVSTLLIFSLTVSGHRRSWEAGQPKTAIHFLLCICIRPLLILCALPVPSSLALLAHPFPSRSNK